MPTVLAKLTGNPVRDGAQMAALNAFAAPVAYLTGGNGTGADHTLSSGAERLGKIWLGTELAGSGTVTPAALKIAERGLRNTLVHVGILPEADRVPGPGRTRVVEVAGADYFTYAPDSGVFEPVAELGDEVGLGVHGSLIRLRDPGLFPCAPDASYHFN